MYSKRDIVHGIFFAVIANSNDSELVRRFGRMDHKTDSDERRRVFQNAVRSADFMFCGFVGRFDFGVAGRWL